MAVSHGMEATDSGKALVFDIPIWPSQAKGSEVLMTVQLEPEIDIQFDEMAQHTGESKDNLVRQALLSYLEDLHDARIIEERLKNPGKRIPLSEVVKNLGLDDVDD